MMYGLDLFSGIGGLTVALSPWVETIAYCEKDRFCQAVLLSRMRSGEIATAPVWDDITTLVPSLLPRNEIDIIFGGFPCQDISVAGRGAGLAGKRSGLFFEIARLISEIRPRFVFLENVSAITVRGAERVVGELCRLRYDCRWGILSAQDVGANHRRERWWLLAHALPTRERGVQWKEKIEKSSMADSEHRGMEKRRGTSNTRSQSTLQRISATHASVLQKQKRKMVPNSNGSRLKESTQSVTGKTQFPPPITSGDDGWWELEPNVGRVAHGVPFRVDRLRGLGNAVVPAQAREAFESLMGLK